MKVCIIEDDKFLREIASEKLVLEGFEVVGTSNGEEMLDQLAKDPVLPDLFILDLILPGMSGFDILKKLKADTRYSQIPVVVLSNLGQEEDLNKAKELGAADYLVKAHFSFADIIKKIKEVLGK